MIIFVSIFSIKYIMATKYTMRVLIPKYGKGMKTEYFYNMIKESRPNASPLKITESYGRDAHLNLYALSTSQSLMLTYGKDEFWKIIENKLGNEVNETIDLDDLYPSRYRMRFVFKDLISSDNDLYMDTKFSDKITSTKQQKKWVKESVKKTKNKLEEISHSAKLWNATIYMDILKDDNMELYDDKTVTEIKKQGKVKQLPVYCHMDKSVNQYTNEIVAKRKNPIEIVDKKDVSVAPLRFNAFMATIQQKFVTGNKKDPFWANITEEYLTSVIGESELIFPAKFKVIMELENLTDPDEDKKIESTISNTVYNREEMVNMLDILIQMLIVRLNEESHPGKIWNVKATIVGIREMYDDVKTIKHFLV